MGFRSPWSLHPKGSKLLGGNEFRLRQGFACGKRDVTPRPAQDAPQVEKPQNEKPNRADHKAPQIKELYSEDFDYTDSVGNTDHFTYRVPQIAADRLGAAAINKSIEETYGSAVESALKDASGGFSLSCLRITWESYRFGDILSLVVSCIWDGGVNGYGVYLYDIAGGQQITTAKLLSALGVDKTAFLEAVRRTAAQRFDEEYRDVPEDEVEAVAERRDWTLSDENINMDVPAYADASGKLCVVLRIGSIAGAEAYARVLPLDPIAK